MSQGAHFKGLEIELHRFSGARVLRVVHPGEQQIGEHRHDRAYIGLYTTGRYRERYDGGEADMCGPSAVLHPAGRPHADVVHDSGLETMTIEFDAAWLRLHGFDGQLDGSRVLSGGAIGLAARNLARRLACRTVTEAQVGRATAQFVDRVLREELAPAAAWIDRVREWIDLEERISSIELARRLDLHPAYLARAYRHSIGEGIGETLRRRRVEAASRMLRRTSRGLADIAIDAGFCDQSHMNRCFSAVLGRTPVQVRRERQLFDERAAAPGH